MRVRWSFLRRTILASVGALVALIAAFFGAIALAVLIAIACSPQGDSHLPGYARPIDLTSDQAVGSGVVGNGDTETHTYTYATNSDIEEAKSAIRTRLVAHGWRVFDDGVGNVGDPWYAASDGGTCLRYVAFDRDLASRVKLAPEPAYHGRPTLEQIVGSRGTVLREIGDFDHLIFIASWPCQFSTSSS